MQPMLTEALGIVFVCGGLAIMLDVSFLIASMVMGAVIANLAKHLIFCFGKGQLAHKIVPCFGKRYFAMFGAFFRDALTHR